MPKLLVSNLVVSNLQLAGLAVSRGRFRERRRNQQASVRVACFLALFCVCASALAGEQPNAGEELERLRREAQTARASNDTKARLEAVLKIQKLLNHAPDAVEDVARIYADAGDARHALEAINEFADLGQTDARLLDLRDKNFSALARLLQNQPVLKRLADNKKAISRAVPVLTIPDAKLVAEDIDYDPLTKSFLITSILEKKIIRLTSDGKAVDFALSPSHWPMLAIKIDAARKVVWATEVALDGFSAAPKADWGRSAVVGYDLGSGALRSRIEGPAHSALGDMVLARDGTPVVSDGDGGGVYRVNGERLERIDEGDYISPQTPATLPDGKHLLVPDYLRGVGILDIATRKTTWLAPEGKYALSGIDGLYFEDGALLASQNGTSPERVIRFTLNSALDRIVSEQIIERATPTLGDPTHGVVVGDSFYYIANSGWDVLDEHGDLKSGAKMTPARIMRFVLHPASAH